MLEQKEYKRIKKALSQATVYTILDSIVILAITLIVALHASLPILEFVFGSIGKEHIPSILFSIFIDVPILAYIYKKWFKGRKSFDTIPLKDKLFAHKIIKNEKELKTEMTKIIDMSTCNMKGTDLSDYSHREIEMIRDIQANDFEITTDSLELAHDLLVDYVSFQKREDKRKIIDSIIKNSEKEE